MSLSNTKFLNGLCKSLFSRCSTKLPTKTSVACIYTKDMKDPNVQKPAPFPYETKKYTFLHCYTDSTTKRFDANTKVIVVDGNIGAGKSAFAKHLADTFDMKYVAEPNLGDDYITPYGYDLRELDPIMPPSFKSCDINTYYKNPHNQNVTLMQYKMLAKRYENYIDAMAHLLNTGQGVVLDRCVFGDFVFMEAMFKAGYIRKEAKEYYYEIYESVTEELLKPHLIVYLDIAPETALKRIKERNNEVEVNSKVLTLDYLASIEHQYKQHYLKTLEKNCELLIYDWNEFGDVDVVIEDIVRIDFPKYNKYFHKLKDWTNRDDWRWCLMRRKYTTRKEDLLNYLRVFRPRVTEVFHPHNEYDEYKEILKKVPGEQYREGFNTSLGDKIWFKRRQFGAYDEKKTI